MSVNKIIREAMDKNPLGMKEALQEELTSRVALALEAKMKKEEDDMEDDMEDDDEDEDDSLSEGLDEVTVANADLHYKLKNQALNLKKKMDKYEGGKDHDKFVGAKEKFDMIIKKLEGIDTNPAEIKRIKQGKM